MRRSLRSDSSPRCRCAPPRSRWPAAAPQGIELAENDPDYEGAELFVEHCSGCHTFEAAGTEGSAAKVTTRENKDGPNFDQRKETEEDVLYAIRERRLLLGPDAAEHRHGRGRGEDRGVHRQVLGPGAPKPARPS